MDQNTILFIYFGVNEPLRQQKLQMEKGNSNYHDMINIPLTLTTKLRHY